MKKGYLFIGAAIFALLIWACGDGSIDPVTDDELLMVGKWDPDIIDIQEACDACLADPECKKEYNKFAKKHGCVPIVDPGGETGWDEDGDGEIDNWGDDPSLPNFKLSSSSKAADDDDEDGENLSSDSEEDDLSSASRHSSSSAPVYSAASVSSEDDEDDPVVREQSSSSKASGKSSSSAFVYSASSTASSGTSSEGGIDIPVYSSSSSKAKSSSSSSAFVYISSSVKVSSSSEEGGIVIPVVSSSSSKPKSSSSSSAFVYISSSVEVSSSSEEGGIVIPVESSSSSKPKNSSSSSAPVYVVSSSSSLPSVASSSSRAARSSSAGVIIETSSVSQSSSSAKSSSSIAPRSSSSKAKSSSSQTTGGSSGSQGGVICGSQLTGICTASEKTIVAGETVTYTYNPSEADLACDGDIVWYMFDSGAAEEVHFGGTSFTTTYTKSGEKKQAAFEKGNRRISCEKITVEAAPPKNCSCTPTRTSTTNDLFDQSPVTYNWSVSGCTVAGVAASNLTYSWSNGVSGSTATVSGSFSSAGTYTPTVNVTTSEGKSASFTCGSAEVKNTPPQNCSCSAANLTSTSNDLFNVDQVNYSWTVSGCTGNGLAYSWSNGASGSTTSVTGTYTSAGTYTPKVTVKTATNASTTVTCGSAEVKNSGPTGCECTSITLKSSSNDLLNVSPVVYEWKATGCQGSDLTYTWGGTGISGNGSTATGTFTAGGSYTPTLRVSTARGGYTDVQCVSGTVKNTAPSNCSCTASLRSDYNDLYKNSPVEYDWSVTGCTGNNLSYAWSNGVSGNTASVTGSYTSTGSYTPKVTVTNMGGASTSVTCETGKVVNYAPPTCSVNDISHVYIGSAVSVVPSSLTGCDYDSDGCNYAITGGTTGGTGDSGYKGGKITGLIGEPNAGDVGSYTLTLTNKIGTGYCNFDVAYADADVVISSKGGSTSVSSGSIVQISSDLTSGVLRCYHGSWQNHNCTVNIESAAMVEQSLGSCQGGSNWGSYIDFPLSSLNADRIAVITFTGVDNGAITCGVQ